MTANSQQDRANRTIWFRAENIKDKKDPNFNVHYSALYMRGVNKEEIDNIYTIIHWEFWNELDNGLKTDIKFPKTWDKSNKDFVDEGFCVI